MAPRPIGRRALLSLGAGGLLAVLACRQPAAIVSEQPVRGAADAPPRETGERAAPAVVGAPVVPSRPTPRATARPPRPVEKHDDGVLQRQIDGFLRQQRGAFGVAIRDLHGPVAAGFQAEDRFPLGSLFKLPLAFEVMRQVRGGAFSLASSIQTLPEYTFGEPRGGVPPNTRLTVDEALAALISASSNAAALALIELVGPEELVAAPRRIGMTETAIDVETVGGPGRYEIDARGSARDVLTFLVKLDREQLVGPEQDRRLIDLMLKQKIVDRLPVLLPTDVPIAHKTADIDSFTHDAGLVYLPGRPFAIAVLAQGLNPSDGRAIVSELSRMAHAFFDERR